jgi:hypothetical protein
VGRIRPVQLRLSAITHEASGSSLFALPIPLHAQKVGTYSLVVERPFYPPTTFWMAGRPRNLHFSHASLKVHAPPRVQLRSSTPVTLGTDITNHQSPLHSFSSRLSAGGGRAPSAYSLRSWPIAFLPLLSFCLAKILTWKWPATT